MNFLWSPTSPPWRFLLFFMSSLCWIPTFLCFFELDSQFSPSKIEGLFCTPSGVSKEGLCIGPMVGVLLGLVSFFEGISIPLWFKLPHESPFMFGLSFPLYVNPTRKYPHFLSILWGRFLQGLLSLLREFWSYKMIFVQFYPFWKKFRASTWIELHQKMAMTSTRLFKPFPMYHFL